MAFQLFDHVRINDKDVTGDIVDIYDDDGTTIYIVQSDKKGHVDDPDAYPGECPLYDCKKDQMTKL